MRLVEIGQDVVTIELTPEDAYLLARACTAAELELRGSDAIPGNVVDDLTAAARAVKFDVLGVTMHFEALSAFFDAASLAAVGPRFISTGVRDQLQLSNLRGGKGQLLEFSERALHAETNDVDAAD